MNGIKGFLGPIPQKNNSIQIIGSGISGLLMGWHLQDKGFDVRIFSDSTPAGGMIHTEKRNYGIVESAANGILWSESMEDLCRKLSLKPLKSKPESANRYILRKGVPRRYPVSLRETLSILPNLFRNIKVQECENMEEFARKAGGYALHNFVVQPALYGIYASESKHLGLKAIFPLVHQELKSGASLKDALKGAFPAKGSKRIPKGLHSFPNGMSDLTQSLYASLKDSIHSIHELPESNENVHTILCTPAWSIPPVVLPDKVLSLLTQIQYAPLLSATFFFKKEPTAKIPKGFGMVIPPSEGFSILGILINDQIFENRTISEEYKSFTCIVGGQGRPILNEMDSQEFKVKIQQELMKILSIKNEPIDFSIHNWKKALPVYSPELPEIWNALDIELKQSSKPAVSLFGNYTGEISIRGLCGTAAKVAERVGNA
jgi:protoporphyrinogen/coproporphyrinogen III oxidase